MFLTPIGTKQMTNNTNISPFEQNNYETILTSLQNGVLQITLNRLEKLNAFNSIMRRELINIIDEAAGDKNVRCLLINANGRAFCAGQDLNDRKPLKNGEKYDLSQNLNNEYNPLFRKIKNLEKPIICAVNGIAAGAGASLALACDITFAAQSANFILSFVKIGLAPDCGITWILPRLIGPQRAMAMAISGEPISSNDAALWGMIWQCVPNDELLSKSTQFANLIAKGAPNAIAAIKSNLQAAWQNNYSDHLDLERDTQKKLGLTNDYSEGVASFMEKRPPNYTGE